MLKFVFWSLMLANGALAAYQLGYLDTVLPDGHEPTRLDQQINPERIRLAPPPVPTENAFPDGSAKSTGSSAQAANPVSFATSVAAPGLSCVEVGNFDLEEARLFAAQLGALGEEATVRRIREAASHMVYMPPQGDREGAERKAGELRRMGVTDFFIIQDGSSLRWGISLGVFKTEEAARAFLATLNQKGVRTARIGQRPVVSNHVAFQFRDLSGAGRVALDAAKKSFGPKEERECAAAA
jgi:cell division septation protein DedD